MRRRAQHDASAQLATGRALGRQEALARSLARSPAVQSIKLKGREPVRLIIITGARDASPLPLSESARRRGRAKDNGAARRGDAQRRAARVLATIVSGAAQLACLMQFVIISLLTFLATSFRANQLFWPCCQLGPALGRPNAQLLSRREKLFRSLKWLAPASRSFGLTS